METDGPTALRMGERYRWCPSVHEGRVVKGCSVQEVRDETPGLGVSPVIRNVCPESGGGASVVKH